MNIIKHITVILVLVVSNALFSQGENPPCGNAGPEVWIYNFTGSNISVKVYPVSMVFKTVTHGSLYKYDLIARVSTPPPERNSRFIGATNKIRAGSPFIVGTTIENRLLGLAYDFQTNQSPTDCDSGIVGLGIYKFEIKDNQGGLIDTFWVEWDYGHNVDFSNPCLGYDIYFEVKSNPNRVEFKWSGIDPFNCTTYNDDSYLDVADSRINRKIEAWRQPRKNISTQQIEILTRAKNIGIDKIIYDGSNSMPIMQDSRRDCIIPNEHDERQSFTSELSCVLSLSLSMQTDVTTPATFYIDPEAPSSGFYARNIVVLSDALLEIYNSKHLTMRQYDNTTDAATMTIKGDPNYDIPTIGLANLILRPSAELIVQKYSTLVLNKYSTVYLDNGSKIRLQVQSRFFNKGAIIGGRGTIVYETGPGSDELTAEDTLIFRDSVNVVLEDSANLEIAPNSVIIFDGAKAKLICNPVSSIRFGKNSKMLFKNGASLFANGTKFASTDADSTWDGIYLSDMSYDTLKNCTIENAYNGIKCRG
ncbi:MAG: hypothetical protein L0Y79_06040 [Chlorobi bacterium]|nr:hypothetical protein [Chlorobiota bacterium]MCI0714951.1 hypothetical protein [Chlorobiota bacterium]